MQLVPGAGVRTGSYLGDNGIVRIEDGDHRS
jgi:hypothetical protein